MWRPSGWGATSWLALLALLWSAPDAAMAGGAPGRGLSAGGGTGGRLFASVGAVLGDEERARELFGKGQEHYDADRFEEALDFWLQAYELLPLPGILVNVGHCYRQLERHSEALEAYRKVLAEMPDAPFRETVEERITELASLLGEEEKDGDVPLEEAALVEESRDEPGATEAFDEPSPSDRYAARPAPEPRGPSLADGPTTLDVGAAVIDVLEAADEGPGRERERRTLTYLAVGGGAVAGLGAVAAGVSVRTKEREAADIPQVRVEEFEAAMSSARTRAGLANALYVTSAAGIGIGAWMLVRDRKSGESEGMALGAVIDGPNALLVLIGDF